MRIFRGFDSLPTFRCAVATIGSFDGVHCGHRVLLNRVRSIAEEVGGESIVLTFDPHPRITLGKAEGLRLLSSTEEKIHLLEAEGIDNVIIIPFTAEFSQLSPAEFLQGMLIERVGIRHLVVGYNHHFGHNKAGDFDFLTDNNAGVNVVRVSQHLVESEKVSSTVIRQTIESGDMALAARLLGHPYIIIGMATAENEVKLPEAEYKELPPAGEYPVNVCGSKNRLTITSNGSLLLEDAITQSREPLLIEF
ncbi:MAG: adenylyltransferase/cytidyltransferase family protein [Alistipes sp.]|nr:adenylyltransferase/cytidyltransferase family protein [Alistipes sp.]